MKQYSTTSTHQTLAYAERIGCLLHGGEVIELVGDLGAGKTTFTKGLAMGLDIDEPIQSPSFTISRQYEARDDLRLVHYDFYRLPDAGIMAAEIDETIHDPHVVTVIEWGEVVRSVVPDERLTITIEATGDSERLVTMSGDGKRSRQILEVVG